MKTVYGRSEPGCKRNRLRGERLEQLCHFRIEPCEGAVQRWRWISLVVAALVLALSGCGGGGGVSMGAPGGDAGEPSLPDKWRQFEDGAPTLRMTRAQVFDAWRSVARQSTHRVSLAAPVSVGSDPASPMPSDTSATFPVDATVEHAVLPETRDSVQVGGLPPELSSAMASPWVLPGSVAAVPPAEVDYQVIRHALDVPHHTITDAGRALCIGRPTLYRKLNTSDLPIQS